MDFTRIQASPDKTRLAAVRSSMEDLDLATVNVACSLIKITSFRMVPVSDIL